MRSFSLIALSPSELRRDLVGMVLVAAAGTLASWAFPDDLMFLTRIAAGAIFVLSIDLIIGYTGVATIGHAMLYGVGAYAAGWICLHVAADPLFLIAVGIIAGSIMGVLQGAIVSATGGLAQVVLSIATVQLAQALANRMVSITGGSDGLAGITPTPLFGLFEFDLLGKTAYWFAIVLLLVALAFAQRIARSPFGLLCRGIKADPVRVRAIGGRVYLTQLKMYALSGGLAGAAGALMAITTGVVGLDSISFDWSAKALVMLVLGGAGNLYGALIGTTLFMIVEHYLAALNPYNWITLIGTLLVLTVVFLPSGLRSLIPELALLSRVGGDRATSRGLNSPVRLSNVEKQA